MMFTEWMNLFGFFGLRRERRATNKRERLKNCFELHCYSNAVHMIFFSVRIYER